MAVPVKHAAAVKWLNAHVGEHEEPLGSNTGRFVRECQAASWLKGTGWAWCVATWLRAWEVAGYQLPYKGAGAYATLDWYRKNVPSWVVPPSLARPGSAVIFNIGSGHLATLVKPVKMGDTTVTTIGGNESDMVKETTRPLSLVRGFVDPAEANPPAPARKPVFVVATSESGHRQIVYVSGASAISRKLGRILNRHGGITITRRKTP